MANKNKNTIKLFAQSDVNSNSDMNTPDSGRDNGGTSQAEIEASAQTFDIDNLKLRGGTRADLHDALSEQKKLAEELRFEVQHLRNRLRGLQEELKARVEIATHANSEIRESRTELNESLRALKSQRKEFENKQASLEKSTKLTERLQDKARGLENSATKLRRKIRSLETKLRASEKGGAALEAKLRKIQKVAGSSPQSRKSEKQDLLTLNRKLQNAYSELADLRGYIDGRKDTWAKVNAELETVRDQLASRTNEVSQLSSDASEQISQLTLSREQGATASEQLLEQKENTKTLNKRISELQHALDHDARNEIATCRTRIAEQSGKLAAQLHELDCLREDNSRIQQYSDSLRIRLQDQALTAKESAAMRHELESTIGAADLMINKLSEQVREQRQLNKDQADTIENVRSEYEREIRQIRFELGAAEDTLAGQETINGQLASDLINNRGYREALESQLGKMEKKSSKAIHELNRQLKRARQEADDYARKLRIKDKAITDLMQELSSHTNKVELKSDFNSVLQKIDGYKSDAVERSNQNLRERVARLLIGNADGRELRFPLFKDRLTIGRTSQNDIQLNMQYVSRRHAVLSTDQGRTRVIDWGSKNGVFVNKKQVTEQFLKSGDILSIGTADFKYEERPKR